MNQVKRRFFLGYCFFFLSCIQRCGEAQTRCLFRKSDALAWEYKLFIFQSGGLIKKCAHVSTATSRSFNVEGRQPKRGKCFSTCLPACLRWHTYHFLLPPLNLKVHPSAKQSACIYDCHSQAAMSVTQSRFTPEPSSSEVHLSVHLLRCLYGLPFKLWIWMLAHHIDTQTTDTETHV